MSGREKTAKGIIPIVFRLLSPDCDFLFDVTKELHSHTTSWDNLWRRREYRKLFWDNLWSFSLKPSANQPSLHWGHWEAESQHSPSSWAISKSCLWKHIEQKGWVSSWNVRLHREQFAWWGHLFSVDCQPWGIFPSAPATWKTWIAKAACHSSISFS